MFFLKSVLFFMPTFCAITGKTYRKVYKRSHSMKATITKLKPNLQKIKIGNRRVKVCTKALKMLKKKPNKSYSIYL